MVICKHTSEQRNLFFAGDIIVWEDDRNGNWDIYGYDMSTGKEFPTCIHPAEQYSPTVSGDMVVWEDKRNGNDDIYGARLP